MSESDSLNPADEWTGEFAQKRQTGPAAIDGMVNEDELRPITSMVVDFLMKKALHEKRKQDRYNPTMLGNVMFHIDYNDLRKEARLVFDKHPKSWKIKEILKEVEQREAEIMTEKWAMHEVRMNDNPFTF
jgi:hypothetical protein